MGKDFSFLCSWSIKPIVNKETRGNDWPFYFHVLENYKNKNVSWKYLRVQKYLNIRVINQDTYYSSFCVKLFSVGEEGVNIVQPSCQVGGRPLLYIRQLCKTIYLKL